MGNKFHKPLSDSEALDRLVSAINSLEEAHFLLQQKKEVCIENIIKYGIGLYFVLGGLLYIFRFKSKSYAVYYAAYPVLLVILKEVIGWGFNLQLDSAIFKLGRLKREKIEIMTRMKAIETEQKSFPVSNWKKSLLDRFLEFVLGEGRNSRNPLICSNCNSHNGMTLREEFDYVSFRCHRCRFFNPAQKMRPASPKLDFRRRFWSEAAA